MTSRAYFILASQAGGGSAFVCGCPSLVFHLRGEKALFRLEEGGSGGNSKDMRRLLQTFLQTRLSPSWRRRRRSRRVRNELKRKKKEREEEGGEEPFTPIDPCIEVLIQAWLWNNTAEVRIRWTMLTWVFSTWIYSDTRLNIVLLQFYYYYYYYYFW